MNPRTTASTLLLAAALAAASFGILPGHATPAFAAVESASVNPAAPTVCDSVQLVVAGSLSSPCYTIRGFRVGAPELLPTMGPIPAYRIPVRITVEEPNPDLEIACPAVIEPYRLAEALGKLPFGSYWVDAVEHVYPFPADSTAPIDSSRIHFAFNVASDSCRTGEGCVLLGFGATGSEGPRIDGCTARANPGERACFDVTLMNPVPVAALQTEITVHTGVFGSPIDPATALVPVSVTATPRAAGFQAAWTANGSAVKIVLYTASSAAIAPGRGAVLHVCYAVKEGTPESVYTLRFGPSLVSSPRGEAIPFCPTFAEITGRICVGVSRCDLNGDGVGDVRDIVRMVRCILEDSSSVCPDSIRAMADCNGDAALDVRDIVCCVRDILTRDGGWGPDPGPSGAPAPDVTNVRFAGPATWTSPLEGHAAIAIDRGGSFGGVQFVLDSGGPARVRDIALADPQGQYALQWDRGPHGEPRVMVYDRGFIEAGSGSATRPERRAGEAAPPVGILLTLEPLGDSGEGGITIRSVRGSAGDGTPLSVRGEGASLSVPPSPVAGVATILPARPNPFVADTEIAFALPTAARASVRLFDVSGRLVRTLHEGATNAGVYRKRWDGRDDRGRTVGAGIYFVRLTVGSAVRTERILRIR